MAAAAYLTRKRGRTASHLNNARLYVAEIVTFFGPDTPMSEIDDPWLAEYQEHAAAQTVKKWAGSRIKRTAVKDLTDPRLYKDTGQVRSKRTTNNYLKALRQLFAIADKVRDPVTRQPVIDRVPEIRLHRLPRRMPRPMPDQELHARLAESPPWTVEAGELARLFGLRLTEAPAARAPAYRPHGARDPLRRRRYQVRQ
jgi:hypothetical protein